MMRFILVSMAWIFTLPVLLGCTEPAGEQGTVFAVNPISFLSEGFEDVTGYSQASDDYSFAFPRDHGSHEEFKNEWWYLTGNLQDDNANHYGFQLTIFRSSINQIPPNRNTNWGVRNVYMGHFTITDTANGRFLQHEKFSRDSLNLAGSSDKELNVWIEDWFITGEGSDQDPIIIDAKTGAFSLQLDLVSRKPIVLQGDDGFSVKSSDGEAASHYYSMTRLDAKGSIQINGATKAVTGTAWMDREWSSTSLGKNHSGWDWFALHLSDGSDLMYYRMRLANGEEDATSGGMVNSESGDVIKLSAEEFTLKVVDYWRSPKDGPIYPAKWVLEIPRLNVELLIQPVLANQELQGVFRYWEGAVSCFDKNSVKAMDCKGYVELTGY